MKSETRKTAKKKRDAISVHDRDLYSQRILENVRKSEVYQSSESIFCYVSYRSEVETHALLRQMIADGKEVYIPQIEKGNPKMVIVRLFNFDDLRPDFMHILSYPATSLPKDSSIDAPAIDLVLLPGLAFDTYGNRLGYGGGYYDRYLEQNAVNHLYALAYTEQIIERVPTEAHDRKVDGIFTESGLITCAQ